MEQVIKLFMRLIKAEVTGATLSEDIISQLTPEMMEKLYQVSSKQDLAHVVALVLKKQNLLGEDALSNRFLETLYLALVRYENIQYELEQICELFEGEQIVHIPLKGSIIRKYYAEPWLRTSCDIDILIRPEDLDRACELLASRLQYNEESRNYKDVSLYAPSGVHLELHFMIQEHNEALDQVLEKVWEYVHPIEEGKYRYAMTPEYFLLHIFAHMSYHFSGGGCGVRTFVDVWLLTKHIQFDEAVLEDLCRRCSIWKFVKTVRKLVNVWFEDEEHDELSLKMQSYVINSGVYGTKESSMTAKKIKTQGRLRFILQRLFMPYVDLCILYPLLKKVPILYPFYTVVRWCKVFEEGVFKRVANEAKLNGEINQEQVDELKELFRELELL